MKKLHISALLFSVTILGACTASTGGGNNLQYAVNENTNAIRQLQAQVANVQPAQADSWSQIQALRQEMAALRGALDNLQNSTAHLGGVPQLGSVIARHDRALRLIETQLAMNLQLDEATPQILPSNTPFDTSTETNTEVITTPTPTEPSKVETTANQDVQKDTAQVLYDTGINSFNAREYKKALNSFKDFTKVYPAHKLVSNAWFWQGESEYQLKNYAGAALAYEKVISQFPNSSKAPACYLKQAMSFIELKKKEAAKQRLNELITIYPKSAEAKRAKSILSTL